MVLGVRLDLGMRFRNPAELGLPVAVEDDPVDVATARIGLPAVLLRGVEVHVNRGAGGVVGVGHGLDGAFAEEGTGDAGRDDVDVVRVPIIEIAKALGNVKAANIVALAAFVTRSEVVKFDALQAAVKNKFAQKEKLIPLNMKALEEGRKAALVK